MSLLATIYQPHSSQPYGVPSPFQAIPPLSHGPHTPVDRPPTAERPRVVCPPSCASLYTAPVCFFPTVVFFNLTLRPISYL